MLLRPAYLNALRTFRNVPLVKLLADILRCGTSTILALFREDLLASGIPQDRIIARNCASEDIDHGQ